MNPTHAEIEPGKKVDLIIVDRTLPMRSVSLSPEFHTRVIGVVDGDSVVLYSESDGYAAFLRTKSLTMGKVLGSRYGCEVHVLK